MPLTRSTLELPFFRFAGGIADELLAKLKPARRIVADQGLKLRYDSCLSGIPLNEKVNKHAAGRRHTWLPRATAKASTRRLIRVEISPHSMPRGDKPCRTAFRP